MSAPSPDRRKPWLSKQVSVQYLLGLVISFGIWAWNQNAQYTRDMAQMRATIEQRPEQIERRNRELDQNNAARIREQDQAIASIRRELDLMWSAMKERCTR